MTTKEKNKTKNKTDLGLNRYSNILFNWFLNGNFSLMKLHHPDETDTGQLPVLQHVSRADRLDQQGRLPCPTPSEYHKPLCAILCCPGLKSLGGPVHMSLLWSSGWDSMAKTSETLIHLIMKGVCINLCADEGLDKISFLWY